jgi:serine/threonine-protein kinase
VRLTDFGLARAAADALMTHSGVVAGTPHYMAPEQARGETIDHRVDLFSLGSTLYAICAGYPPFRAETPMAVLRRVCDDDPRPLRSINPDVPAWLEAVIARLMAKDRAQRFQTASEVAEILGRCLAHVQQPSASPLPAGLLFQAKSRGTTRFSRRWAATAAVGLAAIVPLAAGAWFVRSRGQSPGPASTSNSASVAATRAERSVAARIGAVPLDELQRLFDDASHRARAVQAEILGPPACIGLDPVSEQIARISHELEALQHDVLSLRVGPAHVPEPLPRPRPSLEVRP